MRADLAVFGPVTADSSFWICLLAIGQLFVRCLGNMKAFSTFLSCGLLGAFSLGALLGAPTGDSKGEQFKHDMLPKVGQKITFVGTIALGKFGPYLTSDHSFTLRRRPPIALIL